MLLFYAPEVLHSDGALMRVLVDKHFPVGAWNGDIFHCSQCADQSRC